MDSSGSEIVETVLKEAPCKTGFFSFAFCGNNKFAVFSVKKKGINEAEDPSERKLHIIESECILFDEEVRKLVNESNSTFLSSRNVAESIYDLRSYYLSLSHEHRSTIRQCIENMQLKENDIPEYKEWIEMFDNIEIVWHLCELLHIDTLAGEFVVGRLIEWVRFHCCEVELRAGSLMLEEKPEVTCPDDYWDLATGLLLQARFEATRALLKLHSLSSTAPFMEADNILLTIPIFSADCGISVSEFNVRWKSWKLSVRAKISAGIFSQHPPLLEMMEICAGEGTDLLRRIAKYCDSWYQLVSASLVFADPPARLSDLPYYAGLCIAQFGGPTSLKLLDMTVLAIMESDLPKVVSLLQMSADGGWSASHLSNLLFLCGCFSTSSMEVEVETLLVEYGSLLFSDPALFTAGISYLENCPMKGKRTLSVLLESIEVNSESKAYRLFDVAKKNKLHSVCTSICRCMQATYLKSGLLDSALQWALESGDPELMSQVADKFLHSYSIDYTFTSTSLLHLGASTAASERLTFAAKFAEYVNLMSTGNVKEGADLLVSLMDVKVIPQFFYDRVMLEALTVLELEPSPLSTTQSLVILEFIEEAPTSSTVQETLSRLRATLARRLASTLILDIGARPTMGRTVIAQRS